MNINQFCRIRVSLGPLPGTKADPIHLLGIVVIPRALKVLRTGKSSKGYLDHSDNQSFDSCIPWICEKVYFTWRFRLRICKLWKCQLLTIGHTCFYTGAAITWAARSNKLLHNRYQKLNIWGSQQHLENLYGWACHLKTWDWHYRSLQWSMVATRVSSLGLNSQADNRTKHINAKHHYISKCFELFTDKVEVTRHWYQSIDQRKTMKV